MVVKDVSAWMDSEAEKAEQRKAAAVAAAAARKAANKPVFLWFKDGYNAVVRPVYNFNEVSPLIMVKHFVWNNVESKVEVDAVCAAEIGKECLYCQKYQENPKENRSYQARQVLYFPLFVHEQTDAYGNPVTYNEYVEGTDEKVAKIVKGFRVLELNQGAIYTVMTTLRKYYDKRQSHDITECNFSIEKDQGKFSCLADEPEPADPRITQNRPTLEMFRESIIAARPPVVIQTKPAKPVAPVVASEDDDEYTF